MGGLWGCLFLVAFGLLGFLVGHKENSLPYMLLVPSCYSEAHGNQ